MENIFFILPILILFKYLFVIFLISRKFKKTSYIAELLTSSLIFYIIYNQTSNLYFALLIAETEYLISKIFVLLIVIIIKDIAFRLIVSTTHNGILSKILFIFFNKKKTCQILKRLQEINYGPRLKHGIPAMAGKKHAKTRVKYDKNGFPIFRSFYTFRLPFWHCKKSRQVHFSIANKKVYKKAMHSKKIRKLFTKNELNELKAGDTPDKYTWHHHQDYGKMQLVSRKTHAAVSHIGGYSIWGE